MVQVLAPEWDVHCADSADAACLALAQHGADVVIVNAGLPGRDGFSLIEELAGAYPQVRVMLISAREDAAVRMRAQACGAAGFIGKREASETMIARIATVLAGGTAFDQPDDCVPLLTARQIAVLELLPLG